MSSISKKLWAPWAWLKVEGESFPKWHANVLLTVGADGHWKSITTEVNIDVNNEVTSKSGFGATPGAAQIPEGAEIVKGPLLPSFVNAHSHAFQRAFAGQTEHRSTLADDFWSWRESMYRVAMRVTPEQLQAIASQLYIELLYGGYTQVCEFHYLQHRPNGLSYEDPLTMAWAISRAAQSAGLGLTLLPVLYERAGFQEPELRPNQQRFRQSAVEVWQAAQAIHAKQQALLNAGLAIHSIRAASKRSIQHLLELSTDFNGPIHIHVSEQLAEVEDSLRHYGARPIEWLVQENFLDERWHLVHATHATGQEIKSVASRAASLVICPSTEGNLGDGLSDLPAWLDAKVAITMGSDSQASRDGLEELRWLEYGQRLGSRQRNISADPGIAGGSSGQRLLDLVGRGGAQAAGLSDWGLSPGARADALVLDLGQNALLGVPQQHWLDALLFSSPSQPWGNVMVAGQWVIQEGHHPQAKEIAQGFVQTMTELNQASPDPQPSRSGE